MPDSLERLEIFKTYCNFNFDGLENIKELHMFCVIDNIEEFSKLKKLETLIIHSFIYNTTFWNKNKDKIQALLPIKCKIMTIFT